MIEIRFLGGAGEVGKTAILVDTGVEKFLMDYGVNVQTGEIPIKPDVNLDAVLLSHAHLDHSGLLPELYRRGYNGQVFMTKATLDLSSLLLRDSLKVQKKRGEKLEFGMNEIRKMEENIAFLNNGERQDFTISNVQFFDAGHVPGSSTVLIESRGKRILYTGDIKFMDTKLMNGAFSDLKDIDVMISESTYSYMDHPDRSGLETRLREIVKTTVESGGIALIPAFAVGRTQEMLMILKDIGFPVFIDGMGIKAAECVLRHRESVRDYEGLREAFESAGKITRSAEREIVLAKPCAIITTAGMLNGGPIADYISRLWDRKDCSLTLTGYQVKGTAGRTLLETGRYRNEGLDVKPEMQVEFLDFSAHTDRNHLIKFFKKVNPGKIILVHGDKTKEFAHDVKAMGFEASAPENGESVKV
jgi:putative mRNA 3-end processing factor